VSICPEITQGRTGADRNSAIPTRWAKWPKWLMSELSPGRSRTLDSTLQSGLSISQRMSLRERTRHELGIIEPCVPSPAKGEPLPCSHGMWPAPFWGSLVIVQ
jgi:hypothetical protein